MPISKINATDWNRDVGAIRESPLQFSIFGKWIVAIVGNVLQFDLLSFSTVALPSIIDRSFAIIDREIGDCHFTAAEYAIVRRVIHATADFELKDAIAFSKNAIDRAITAIKKGTPIVADTNMVKAGIVTLASKYFGNPVIAAVSEVETALPGKTRTETGILHCCDRFPDAIFAIGNAPTALLALCDRESFQPALVVGAPVGFVAVVESKQALAATSLPQIRIDGRKGGSPATAAIVNALIELARSD